MSLFHEDIVFLPEFESVDDGPQPDEIARDEWAEVTLSTLADTQECDWCGGEALTPLSPVASGAPQGHALRRRGGEAFACEGCVETAGEAGWSRW